MSNEPNDEEIDALWMKWGRGFDNWINATDRDGFHAGFVARSSGTDNTGNDDREEVAKAIYVADQLVPGSKFEPSNLWVDNRDDYLAMADAAIGVLARSSGTDNTGNDAREQALNDALEEIVGVGSYADATRAEATGDKIGQAYYEGQHDAWAAVNDLLLKSKRARSSGVADTTAEATQKIFIVRDWVTGAIGDVRLTLREAEFSRDLLNERRFAWEVKEFDLPISAVKSGVADTVKEGNML